MNSMPLPHYRLSCLFPRFTFLIVWFSCNTAANYILLKLLFPTEYWHDKIIRYFYFRKWAPWRMKCVIYDDFYYNFTAVSIYIGFIKVLARDDDLICLSRELGRGYFGVAHDAHVYITPMAHRAYRSRLFERVIRLSCLALRPAVTALMVSLFAFLAISFI